MAKRLCQHRQMRATARNQSRRAILFDVTGRGIWLAASLLACSVETSSTGHQSGSERNTSHTVPNTKRRKPLPYSQSVANRSVAPKDSGTEHPAEAVARRYLHLSTSGDLRRIKPLILSKCVRTPIGYGRPTMTLASQAVDHSSLCFTIRRHAKKRALANRTRPLRTPRQHSGSIGRRNGNQHLW